MKILSESFISLIHSFRTNNHNFFSPLLIVDKVNTYDILPINDPIQFGNLFTLVLEDKNKGVSNTEIAAKFHLSLVNLIRHEAEKQGVKKIAFSGGVFQNSLLIDLIKTILQDEFELIFHQRLSSNDENISYGQLAYFTMHEKTLNNEISNRIS